MKQQQNMKSALTTIENVIPGDVQAEEGVLSCLLFNPRNAVHVMDILRPEHFSRADYGTIFQAAQTVHRQGKWCSRANVTYELRRQGKLDDIGGEIALIELNDSTTVLSNIRDHAEKVKEEHTFREIARLGYEMFQSACQREDGVLERAQSMLSDIAMGAGSDDTVRTMSDVMTSLLKQIDERRDNFSKKIANGVPTGFVDLDRMLGGLQPADLLILAARPSVGKTALSTNIALNIVQRSRHALMFSLEMKAEAIAQRMLAMEVPMDQTFIRDGDIDDEEMGKITEVAGNLAQLDFKVDDRTRSIEDIKNKARRVHAQKKLDVIVVDYLQLIRPATDLRTNRQKTRAEEVAEMSKALKELAMELNVPVLALAQLNRAIESRSDKTPQLSDLKESGSIEQDADVIMFLHVSDEQLEVRNQCKPYQISIIVGKQRNGRVGSIDLVFRPRSTKFTDLSVEDLSE